MNGISRVVAVGASGPFAGLVVPALAKRGLHVRGLVKSADQQVDVRDRGATEVVVADIADRNQMASALNGMDAAFYISPFALENEARVGQQFVELAKAAGVRRIVFSSLIHPNLSGLENHTVKLAIEASLIESGLEFTILQPAVFFQNIGEGWKQAQKTGTYAEPWSTETRFSRVDYRDVADVAAIAFAEDRLLYGTFELSAEGRLNRIEIASLMSEVLGRPIKAEKAPLPPADKAPAQLIEMMRWYDRHSLVSNPTTLNAILGGNVRTLRDYLVELQVPA